jgi:hypothetical protein
LQGWGYPLEEAAESTKLDGLSPGETVIKGSGRSVDVALDREQETGNNEPTASDTR